MVALVSYSTLTWLTTVGLRKTAASYNLTCRKTPKPAVLWPLLMITWSNNTKSKRVVATTTCPGIIKSSYAQSQQITIILFSLSLYVWSAQLLCLSFTHSTPPHIHFNIFHTTHDSRTFNISFPLCVIFNQNQMNCRIMCT